jgi:hypothetical protein
MSVLDQVGCTMPAERYHADDVGDRPSLSASIAHTLLTESPLHAWTDHPKLNPAFTRPAEPKFDVGTAAHALLFENAQPVIIDAADWRTNAAKEQRDEARKAGGTPLLAHQAAEVTAMVDAVRAHLAALDVDPPLFRDGDAEQTLVWEDDGVLCRARLDWLRNDYTTIDDLKTTARSANPRDWCRTTLWSIGADIQTAFYIRGVKALTGVTPAFRYCVIETTPPYALSVIDLSPEALVNADAKVDAAIATWRECMRTGVWPAYPTRACSAALPPWEVAA